MKQDNELYIKIKLDYMELQEKMEQLKKELEKEKEKNKFLIKRENKLQMIECYVNNKKETKLDKLIEIIKRSDK